MPTFPKGRLIFARRAVDGLLVGIHEVPNGRRCRCVCPKCSGNLVAKQGPQRAHFAHIGRNGHGCGPSAWHEALCDALASLDVIEFRRHPLIPRLSGKQRILRTSKTPLLDGEFIPDVLLELQSGLRVVVEVVHSHDISGLKLAALEQESYQVLRVDARGARQAMSAFPFLRENLAALMKRPGSWQGWPQIHSQPRQAGLTLAPSSWLERAISFATPTPLAGRTNSRGENDQEDFARQRK